MNFGDEEYQLLLDEIIKKLSAVSSGPVTNKGRYNWSYNGVWVYEGPCESEPATDSDVPTEPYIEAAREAKSEGMSCNRCTEFASFAEANQPDGTFLCYCCRSRGY